MGISLRLAWFSYLVKTVLIHEVPIALGTVVLIVPFGLHVLVGSFMGVEHLGTCFASNFWLPMVLGIHMLIGSSLRREGTTAGFAFKDWCPVIKRIHVLLAATLSPNLSRAGLTFNPMAVFVHVSIAVLAVAELKVTGATFVHLDLKA